MMRIYVAKVEGHSFLTAPLGPDSTVVDLGMNVGSFARWITVNTGARVIGVEPAPALCESMPVLPRPTLVQAAISSSMEAVVLVTNEASCAALEYTGLGEASARRVTVPALTLEQLFRQHDIEIADLLKIDIEGAELDVLANAPADLLMRCRQITCEFHNFLDPSLTPRVREVSERLKALGFIKMTFSLDDTDTLFVRPSLVGLRRFDLALASAAFKYGRGTLRRLRRLVEQRS